MLELYIEKVLSKHFEGRGLIVIVDKIITTKYFFFFKKLM